MYGKICAAIACMGGLSVVQKRPWTPTAIPRQLVPLPQRRPCPKEKGSMYDSPSAQNTSLARTWRCSWPCGSLWPQEEIRKFEVSNHPKKIWASDDFPATHDHGTAWIPSVVCSKIAVACNQPIRTHQGLQWSWPTHQTVPPDPWAGMLQLFQRLSFSLPSLFWAKSHSSEQYSPADQETQRRLTLALAPPSLIVDIPCRRKSGGRCDRSQKLGWGDTKNSVFHGTAPL